MNDQLIKKLSVVLRRAYQGDQECLNYLKRLRSRALAGDYEAKVEHNTAAVLHWQVRAGSADYAKAEAFYGRLLNRDPDARRRLNILIQRLRQKDAEALRLFRILKAIHHKYKASAWTGPGSPKIGGYSMPNIHRAGIDIPGLGNVPTPWDPPPPPNPWAQFLPLTPQALQGLLQLIQMARMSVPSMPAIPGMPSLPGIFRSSNPDAGGPSQDDLFMMQVLSDSKKASSPSTATTTATSAAAPNTSKAPMMASATTSLASALGSRSAFAVASSAPKAISLRSR